MKYLKLSFFYLIVLIITNLFLSILAYFNISNEIFNDIIMIIVLIFSYFIMGVYLGKNSYRNEIIDSIKMCLILIMISVIISLICKFDIGFKNITYYLLNSIVMIFGCKLGMNLDIKKRK